MGHLESGDDARQRFRHRPARAFGTYDFKIIDPRLFLKEVAGTDHHFRLDEFADTMRSRIVSLFSEALAQSKIPVLDVASRYSEVGEALLPLINPVVIAKYGLEMTSFILENVSVPPEVEQAIDKRSSMAAVGNLNDYVKFQMATGDGAAGNGRRRGWLRNRDGGRHGDGSADDATTGRYARAADHARGRAAPARTPNQRAPAVLPELLSPAEAAKVLGVTEADVLHTLESGELKGKKIGASWRVTPGGDRRISEELESASYARECAIAP